MDAPTEKQVEEFRERYRAFYKGLKERYTKEERALGAQLLVQEEMLSVLQGSERTSAMVRMAIKTALACIALGVDAKRIAAFSRELTDFVQNDVIEQMVGEGKGLDTAKEFVNEVIGGSNGRESK